MGKFNKNANDEVGKNKESVEHCIALIKSVKNDKNTSPNEKEKFIYSLYMEASKDCSVIEYYGFKERNSKYIAIAQELRSLLNSSMI